MLGNLGFKILCARLMCLLFRDEVKVKMEPIDEDVCAESQETQESIETQVWVKVRDISWTNL